MTWAGLALTSPANRPSLLSPEIPAGIYGDGLVTLPDSELADAVTEAMPLLVTGDGNGFMNKVTLTLNPPPPRPARAAAAPES